MKNVVASDHTTKFTAMLKWWLTFYASLRLATSSGMCFVYCASIFD